MTDRGIMGALAAMDQYHPVNTLAERFPEQDWTYAPPPDANEVAAARLARPYTKANLARMSEEHPVAEFALGMAPQEPWQYGMMFAGPGASLLGRGIAALPTVARVGAAALGFGLQGSEAQGKPKIGSLFDVGDLKPRGSVSPAKALDFWRLPDTQTRPQLPYEYVNNVQRVFAPGIYKDPRVIAAEGAANVAPEHPAMKALFGVTRDDLWEIGQRGTRPGNMEPSFQTKPGAKGSYMSDAVMTPANAQRQIDVLAEAQKYPELIKGMDSWYVSDPMFWQMVKNVGPERALRDYKRFNTVVPMFSPASDVVSEINRGTAANMMIERGQFPRFERYGGIAVGERGRGFPKELRDVKPHPYHGTAHTGPVGRYLATGDASDMQTVKVPLYMQASGVPETGFQTKLPIPDAHITRSTGMADVREGAKPGVSMKTPEYTEWGPWYRENVAKPLGLEAVPAQGRQWGVYAPQTGVNTAIGAPKLEILSKMIWERAAKLGIDPKVLRDQVLHGKGHAVWPLAAGAGLMGSIVDQGEYND